MSPAAPRPVLAAIPSAPGSPPAEAFLGAVCVDVENSMVAAALSGTARQGGWSTRHMPGAGSVLITDRIPSTPYQRGADAVVLVIEPTPFGARQAVDALGALRITSVVAADRPEDLEAALECLVSDRASLPRRVLELAAQMPDVSERQVGLLGAVLAGQTTSQMARGLHLSPASVKRELSTVSSVLGVGSRPTLFARALELGVRPAPLLP